MPDSPPRRLGAGLSSAGAAVWVLARSVSLTKILPDRPVARARTSGFTRLVRTPLPDDDRRRNGPRETASRRCAGAATNATGRGEEAARSETRIRPQLVAEL